MLRGGGRLHSNHVGLGLRKGLIDALAIVGWDGHAVSRRWCVITAPVHGAAPC
jgi:hypothetical protein